MRAGYDGLPGDGYLVRVRGTCHAGIADAPSVRRVDLATGCCTCTMEPAPARPRALRTTRRPQDLRDGTVEDFRALIAAAHQQHGAVGTARPGVTPSP
jgi:hypothetical protein